MKLKPILIGLILLLSLTLPALAATGEDSVKIIKKDGSSSTDGIKKADDDENSNAENSNTSSDTNNIDVWGLQQSDMARVNYADISLLTRIYSGITPLRNVSLLGIAIAFGLSLTSILGGGFLLVFIAVLGGMHPNIKKGMLWISGARGRLLGIFGVFFLALFMIVLTFFFLAIFNKLSLFVA